MQVVVTLRYCSSCVLSFLLAQENIEIKCMGNQLMIENILQDRVIENKQDARSNHIMNIGKLNKRNTDFFKFFNEVQYMILGFSVS